MNEEVYKVLIERLAALRKALGEDSKAKNYVDGIENFVLGARLGTASMEKGGLA